MRVNRFAALVAIVATLCIGSLAQAGVILDDDLQSYANQAAFEATWTPIAAVAPSSTVFVTTGGGPGGSTKWASVPSGTTSSYRNRRSFTETGNASTSNAIAFSYDFWDSNSAAAPYRVFANIQDGTAPTLSGQLITMGLNNSLAGTSDGGNYYIARILGYDGGTGLSGYFKLNQGPASTLRSTGWHNLKVVVTNTTFKFYVDQVLASTETNALTLRSYENVTIGSGVSSATQGGLDNIKVITDNLAVVATGASPSSGTTDAGIDNGGGSIDLSLDWADDTNDKWNLFLWKSSDPVPTTPTAAGLATSAFNATGLDGSTEYSWRVDSLNAFDDLATGTVATFTTAAVPEPVAAGLLLIGAGLFSTRCRRA